MGCIRYVQGSHIKCAVKETEWEVRCCTDLSFLPPSLLYYLHCFKTWQTARCIPLIRMTKLYARGGGSRHSVPFLSSLLSLSTVKALSSNRIRAQLRR
jgi:hypothetical protein